MHQRKESRIRLDGGSAEETFAENTAFDGKFLRIDHFTAYQY